MTWLLKGGKSVTVGAWCFPHFMGPHTQMSFRLNWLVSIEGKPCREMRKAFRGITKNTQKTNTICWVPSTNTRQMCYWLCDRQNINMYTSMKKSYDLIIHTGLKSFTPIIFYSARLTHLCGITYFHFSGITSFMTSTRFNLKRIEVMKAVIPWSSRISNMTPRGY